MRAPAWLTIGVALGIGVGWLLGSDNRSTDRSDRAPVRVAPSSSETGERPRTTPSRSEPAPEAALTAGPASSADVEPHGITSSRDETPLAFVPLVPGSVGNLIVECDGERVEINDVSVYATGMWGQLVDVSPEEDPEDDEDPCATSATYKLWPGSVSVQWYDEESRQVQATIRAGETTVVSTDTPRVAGDDPIPARHGRMVVSIRGLEGNPIADATFVLFGPGHSGVEEEHIEVDGTGRMSLDVKPGQYRVVVGSQSREATVLGQRVVSIDVQFENEGEVEFEAPENGRCWLQFMDGDARRERPPFVYGYVDSVWRLMYVVPGTYDFIFQASGESVPRNLGRVQVRARQRTRFRPTFPTGSVILRLPGLGHPPVAGLAALELLDSDVAPASIVRLPGFERDADAGKFVGSLTISRLPAGRWRLRYHPKGFLPVTREFQVADKPVEATIELTRTG
jgi:hypothetical protein